MRRAVAATWGRLDRVERLLLLGLLALAHAALAGLVLRVALRGGTIGGGDGYLVADALQYPNWLRGMAEQGAAPNRYDIPEGLATFVHPGLWLLVPFVWLGVSPVWAYLLVKPLPVLALFAASWAFVRRHLAQPRDRHLALAIALCCCIPAPALADWLGLAGPRRIFDFDFLAGELWPANWLWGYVFTAVAVACVPAGLLWWERARAQEAAARTVALVAGAALLASWLQPWQGATLLGTLVAAEALVLRRERAPRAAWARAARRLLLVGAAGSLPLIYYFVLSKADPAWELAASANELPRLAFTVLVLGLGPLALPAALAYRLPAADVGAVLLRAWPLVALLVYFQPGGTFPFHAFQGLALPLAVLGVQAWRARLGASRALPALAAASVAFVLVVPGTIHRGLKLQDAVAKGFQPFFLVDGEVEALRFLDAQPGGDGVLAPIYTGLLVPAWTGKPTWLGAGSWTPDKEARQVEAEDLFAARLSPVASQALVRRSRARWVLRDCNGRAAEAELTRRLGALVGPPRRFGCATIWRVR